MTDLPHRRLPRPPAAAFWERGLRILRQDGDSQWKIAFALIFTVILFAQAAAHRGETQRGRPYENWDEISAFQEAQTLVGPGSWRGIRYGSMHTFLQWAALVHYNYRDLFGASHYHLRYSNNVAASFADPFLPFRERTGTGLDYSYFRGSDDRQAIFTSRQFHLAFAYLVILAAAYLSVAVYGRSAIFLFLPLLCLSASPVVYFETSQSLSNAINMFLVFGCVLSAIIFCDQLRTRYLSLSVACLALGLNFKPDIVVVAAAPALVLALFCRRRGIGLAFQEGLHATAVFLAVLIATRPSVIFSPIDFLRERYHFMIQPARPGFSWAALQGNVNWLSTFLGENVGMEEKGSFFALGLVSAALGGCLLWAFHKRSTSSFGLAIGAVVTVLLWVGMVLKAEHTYDRYLLNGLGAFYATAGMGLLYMHRSTTRWRMLSRVLVLALAIQYFTHIVPQTRRSLEEERSAQAFYGFDPQHHRNLASFAAAELIRQRGLPAVVLVDQHAYIDLRILRMHGIDARYVNMFNLASALSQPDPAGPHLVIFARGTYDTRLESFRPWMGDWTPELQQRYDSYQARLLALPFERRFEGDPQNVLSAAPVNARDDIYVALLTLR